MGGLEGVVRVVAGPPPPQLSEEAEEEEEERAASPTRASGALALLIVPEPTHGSSEVLGTGSLLEAWWGKGEGNAKSSGEEGRV